jgi:hypothetical protein
VRSLCVGELEGLDDAVVGEGVVREVVVTEDVEDVVEEGAAAGERERVQRVVVNELRRERRRPLDAKKEREKKNKFESS